MLAFLAAAAIAATPADPTVDPAEELRQLQVVYDQSCNDRMYGTYDDVCSGLATQIRQFRAEVARHPPRAAAKAPSAAPAAAKAPSPPSTQAAASPPA